MFKIPEYTLSAKRYNDDFYHKLVFGLRIQTRRKKRLADALGRPI